MEVKISLYSANILRTVLLIDDHEENLNNLTELLCNDYRVLSLSSFGETLGALNSIQSASLILMNIPDSECLGYKILNHLHDSNEYDDAPVMAIVPQQNKEHQENILSLGATDIISVGYSPDVLKNRIKNVITTSETVKIQQLNQVYELERHETEFDKLTGIYNKDSFTKYVHQLLVDEPDVKRSIIRFDIDRFKVFNDTFGYDAGSKLLSDIGQILRSIQKSDTFFSRLESDHFVGLVRTDNEAIVNQYKVFQDWLSQYPTDFTLSSSMGVYEVSDSELEISLMCDRALMALRSVKGSYSDKVAWYTEEMREMLVDEQTLTGEMDAALASGQFIVYYQPQVDYVRKCVVGAEALVRWKHPVRGLIPPDKFIPLFEKNGFITKLDEYVWEEACKFIKQSLYANPKNKEISISVNISRVDLFKPTLCDDLSALIKKYEIKPASLRLEITEGVYIEDSGKLAKVVMGLQAAGFSVEMDDFGSGYSSLNTLKDVPVNVLKLDMKFLKSYPGESRSGSILSSVVRMAKWMHLPIIAEGVETREQAEYLKNIGAYNMQGYFFGKPMPAEEFLALIEKHSISSFEEEVHFENYDITDFWDTNAQDSLIFSNYVGSAFIGEYYLGKLESIKANDSFFNTVGIHRSKFEPFTFNMMDYLEFEFVRVAKNAIEEAILHKIDVPFEVLTMPLLQKEGLWLNVKCRLLAEIHGRYLMFFSIEDISIAKKAEEITRRNALITEAVLSNGTIMVWKYNIKEDTLFYQGNNAPEILPNKLITNTECSLIEDGIICEESHDVFRQMFNEIRNGYGFSKKKIKLISNTGEKITVEFTCVTDKNNGSKDIVTMLLGLA